MNPMKDSLEIMDELIGSISQTDTWNNIQIHDPSIKATSDKLDSRLEQLQGKVPDALIEEIHEAAWGLNRAFEYPTILYGIRVAMAIQDVTDNPCALSQHIMDRVAAQKKGE